MHLTLEHLDNPTNAFVNASHHCATQSEQKHFHLLPNIFVVVFSGTFVCSFLHGCTFGGVSQERPGGRGLRGRKETRSRAPLPPVYRNSKAKQIKK